MAALDTKNPADTITYGYLTALRQIITPIDQSGGVRISDLAYWNSTDSDSSKEKGATLAWGLHQSCIQNAKPWKANFVGTAQEHNKAMFGLISVMQNPEKFVSDISAALGKLFSFGGQQKSGPAKAKEIA